MIKMDKTPIQQRIELSVTNGRGYDFKTDFSKSNSIYADGLDAESVKNTSEGLRAHLLNMDTSKRLVSRLVRKNKAKSCGFIYSSSGEKMYAFSPSMWAAIKLMRENSKAVGRAYSAEAKRNGRFKTLYEGVLKGFFGVDEKVIERSVLGKSFG